MIPSSRFLYSRALLTSLALITAATHAAAQEQTARLVKDINRTPGVFHSAISWVMPVGTAKNVVFPMDTLALGQELYISDGTPKGTRLLNEFIPGPDSSYLRDPVTFGTGENTKVAFVADDYRSVNALCVTDGTEAGTAHVFRSVYGQSSGGIQMCSTIPGGFFFEDYQWNNDPSRTLYFSDGTAAGTWPLNPLTGITRERFSKPHAVITSSSVAYFIANDDEVWRSDGTEAGTTKLTTIPAESGLPYFLAVAGTRIFIVTQDAQQQPQLLRCPTAGGDLTNLTPPEAATWQSIELKPQSALGDNIFFTSYQADATSSLWVSDGFTTGTRRIPLLAPGASAESQSYGPVVKWQDAVYLSTRTPGSNNYQLWRTDGTDAGTTFIKDFAQQNVRLPTHPQDSAESFTFHLVTPNYDGEFLWQTQGDEASTRPIKKTPDCFNSISDGPQFALAESGLIFSADQSTPDAALYRVKGPKGGAIQLTKPETATGNGIPNYSELPYQMLGSNLLQIVDTGNGLEIWKMKPDGKGARSVWKIPGITGEFFGYVGMHGTLTKTTANKKGKVTTTTKGAIFTIYNGEGHHEVWITNGTPASTRLLSQHETLAGSQPLDFQKLGETMYYSVPDEGAATRSLWKTDGTAAGTSRVLSFSGKSPGPDHGEMVEFQGSVFYLSTSANGKTTMWRAGGDAEGIAEVKGRWIGAAVEKASSLSVVGGKMYVSVLIDTEEALWESDGTVTGTRKTTPALTFKTGTVGPAYDLNGVAVFRAQGLSDPYPQWWRHTPGDTSRVRNNITTEQLPDIDSRYQAVVGNKLFYRGKSIDLSSSPISLGEELWVTDGTDAGTHLVKDILPGPASSAPVYLTTSGNAVYFNAWDDEHGNRIWRSDGTEAGTVPAANFGPGTSLDIARGLKPMAGKLYFHLSRREIGDELHYIDLPLE